MIKDRAMELVAELRSGRHEQTQNVLQRIDGSKCCLGVACAIMPGLEQREEGDFILYNDYKTFLPDAAVKYYNFFDSQGNRWDGKDLRIAGNSFPSLVIANDNGCTFSQIADYIEANWEAL